MVTQIASVSDEAITRATGRGWAEWIALLDQAGARELTHREIARWLADTGQVSDGRWCQAVTVGYEQAIGRREVNQNCYGEFVASVSKTLSDELELDGGLEWWQARVRGRTTFNEVALAAEPRVSGSERWRYWRAALADGSKLTVSVSRKPNGKLLLSLEHTRLAGKPAVDDWKRFWKALLT